MRNYLIIIAMMLFFSACQEKNTSELNQEIADLKSKLEELKTLKNKNETGFIHTVFFWMKEGVTEEQKKEFMDNGLVELIKVPSIYEAFIGPAAQTPREVVDNTYDAALICHFKNKADHDIYQGHDIHLQFIEKYKDLWGRVQVYDNLVEE